MKAWVCLAALCGCATLGVAQTLNGSLFLSHDSDSFDEYRVTAGYTGKVVIGQMLDAEMRDQIQAILATSDTALIEAEKRILGCAHAELVACRLRHDG